MILCFGELMLRLAPAGPLRWPQALPGHLQATFAGAEANVAANLAILGMPAAFATMLPDNPIAEAAIAALRQVGVQTRGMHQLPRGRLGVYYYEPGIGPRAGHVAYDRAGSTLALCGPDDYDFQALLAGVDWVHLSGITPALSASAHEANLELARHARSAGCTLSCDLNFRNALWRWSGEAPQTLARRCMKELLPLVNVVLSNPEQVWDVLAIGRDPELGLDPRPPVEVCANVAAQLLEIYPKLTHVALTLRETVSASRNRWAGTVLAREEGVLRVAPRNAAGQPDWYEIDPVVDRLGAGDAFAAGLIYALRTPALRADAVSFATALGCLKHGIAGDFCYIQREEVDALLRGGSSRIRR